ncbi:Peptidyl-prolyl cis-trans isomerase (rotamase) - cyclophilin family [Marinobacter subterrani]|uniref:Peptidyl-prolyl cis-trans isomerase n=1 Tax=Marinobacter subterrani TaxID=1658765 RepID=A0A0J7J8G8_9GAMM|nr:peptidylprolyl isomerase [Marinobacter subterrani]KMQ74254.1 Peptidyl-prolyl cis-trans isomerase (rotamase) - cyclophilin family [Marinobacter subterrani]
MTNLVKPVKSVIPVLIVFLAMMVPAGNALAQSDESKADDQLPRVRMVTSEGPIELLLRPDVAPETVANFLQYAKSGFFDGTIFHRVIPGFMIQGGGFTKELDRKPTRAPVRNEARPTLPNLRGTIAMARTSAPDSATSQFFINLSDNDFLNAGVRGPGYAVFGKVTEGMGVVDAIARKQTTRKQGMADVPVEPVIIESVTLLDSAD